MEKKGFTWADLEGNTKKTNDEIQTSTILSQAAPSGPPQRNCYSPTLGYMQRI